SAVGVMCSPRRVEVVQSWPYPLEHDALGDLVAQLVPLACDRLGVGGTIESEAVFDCRYLGQSHELRVGSVAEFEEEHERRNGYRRPGHPVEVLAVRAVAWQEAPVGVTSLPSPARSSAVGPMVVAEEDRTIWVPDG